MNRMLPCFLVLSTLVVVLSIPANAQRHNGLPGTDSLYFGTPTANCACHSGSTGPLGKLGLWVTTKHSWAYDSISFIQNNSSCLPCHTTGWDTTSHIGGFSDFFPPANHADSVGILATKNVQCESCHKPYSTGGAYDTSLVASKCGQCHGGDPHTPIYNDWQLSKHAFSKYTSIPGNSFRFIASDPNCSGCHTAEGFLQWAQQAGYSPNVVPADTTKSAAITCAACHSSHGSSNLHQLRLPVAAICERCHNPEYPPDSAGTVVGQEVHHSTAYMFEGLGGYQYQGVPYFNSPHTTVVLEKCARCHVWTTAFVSETQPAYTGHSFTPQKGACADARCHGTTIDTSAANPNPFDFRRTQTVCDSIANVLSNKLAAATPADSLTDLFKRAKFNYDFYEADGSHGIHNTKYAQGLLLTSIANFSPTGVVEPRGSSLPRVYELKQNYPNPFNPSTSIEFSIAGKQEVRLEVYDIMGSLVITLANHEMAAGSYRAVWNGRDQNGVAVASGLYFYRLQAGSYVAVRKMVLIK